MFEKAISCGKHLICDIKNINNTELLNSKLNLKLLCKNICMENNFTILDEADHDFIPQGCSFVFLLSESHLSVHTFPERNHLSFDLYTCRQYDDDDPTYIEIYNTLCEKLNACFNTSNYKIIDRCF